MADSASGWRDLGKGFDGDASYASHVCGRAGLMAEVGSRQKWRVNGADLTVALLLDSERVIYVMSVIDGWPVKPLVRSLLLPDVYAAAISGSLKVRKGTELVRWRARALIDAGLIRRPDVNLAALPPNPPQCANETWHVIGDLLAIRRVTEVGPPEPVPLVAPWLEGWTGHEVPESTFRAGKEWLEGHGFLTRAGTAPGSFGRLTQLWAVAENSANPTTRGTK